MNSLSSSSSPFDVVVPLANPKAKTLTFVGPNRQSVERIRDALLTQDNLEGKWKIYAAKVRKPGDWKITFGVNPSIMRGIK